MSSQSNITILHISDIHLGGNHEKEMITKMIEDVEQLKQREGLTPTYIIASGDLTNKAEIVEFNNAASQLKKIATRLQVALEKIVSVPGNHDISWAATKLLARGCKLSNDDKPYNKKWENYASFVNQLRSAHKTQWNIGEPWEVHEFTDDKLAIFAMNSTWAESHEEDHHHGELGNQQIKYFADKADLYINQGWLRIGVLHHNLREGRVETYAPHPLATESSPPKLIPDTAFLKDTQEFNANLKTKINLILHGHVHSASITPDGLVPVFATGTASAGRNVLSYIPQEIQNQYQIIQISATGYKRWVRTYSPNRNQWVGDCSVSTHGDTWHERVRHSFKNAAQSLPKSKKTYWGAAKGYLEAGDYVTGLEVLNATGNPDNTHEDKLWRIRQKFGHFNSKDLNNYHGLAKIRSANDTSPINYKEKITVLKAYSQLGNSSQVKKIFGLIEGLSGISDSEKRGALNRMAVHHAIEGELEKAKKLFDRSRASATAAYMGSADPRPNEHAQLTSNSLAIACTLLRSPNQIDDTTFLNSITELNKIQREYLGATYQLEIGEIFPFKSTIQTMFSVASAFLWRDPSSRQGWTRLIAASLLGRSYAGVNPLTEGFAELRHLIYLRVMDQRTASSDKRKDLWELVTFALDATPSGREKFLELIRQSRHWDLVPQLAEINDIIRSPFPRPADWAYLQDFLLTCDE